MHEIFMVKLNKIASCIRTFETQRRRMPFLQRAPPLSQLDRAKRKLELYTSEIMNSSSSLITLAVIHGDQVHSLDQLIKRVEPLIYL